LLELDKMKTAFLQQASHDLRTPLAAIKGSLDNLTLGVAGELTAKQSRIVDRATRSVDRLTNLINDILDLSRIETGRTKLEKTNLSLKTIVENSMQEHKPAAEARQIQMEPLICDAPLFIHADASKIERIVGELINNAIKYTPANGTIKVSLEEKDSRARLRVIDSGIGMAPEECHKIWERFYRTTDSQFLAKGSGLGLSIAKELVELHEGIIEVNSTKGEGSTFTVLLPTIKESIPHAKGNDHHS
jgi:signal transduction histidine kinase